MSTITIKEIARMADVSIGTVDRVLHDRGNVNPEKRERVLEICRQANYQPNLLARAMKLSTREKRIAVIINNPEKNIFSHEVKDGLDDASEEWRDFHVAMEFMYLVEETVQEESAYLDAIMSRIGEYDGLIIKPINSPEIAARLTEIGEQIPVFAVTSSLEGYEPALLVGQDHKKAGRLAANMLLKCLPRVHEVSILSVSHSILSRKQKLEGFIQCLKEKNDQMVIHGKYELDNSPMQVYRLTREILTNYPGTQALYAHTRYLDKVHQAIAELGRADDLLVFSFGTLKEKREPLLDGLCAFAIEEIPYQHGYIAGKEMLNLIIYGKSPMQKICHVDSRILIEENVR